jgi:photosystem II stability/assembly factor-like uncharacterized protein
MTHRRIRLARFLPCILLFFAGFFGRLIAQAQTAPEGVFKAEGITNMFPISSGVGYAISGGRLLWTNDNGAVWTDITPPGPADQEMFTLFFLDAAHGWVAFVDGSGEWDPETTVRLVRTVDGGRTWSPLTFSKSSFPNLKGFTVIPKNLWFVDAQHGWFQWQFQTSSAFSLGALFSTSDGGTTWTELPTPPSAHGFHFHTTQDGWIVGDPPSELHVTHDGGRTWQLNSVPAPSNCLQCIPSYSPPEFQDPNNAVLEVQFADHNNAQGHHVYATYVTRDGGNSWQNTEALEQNGADLMNNRVITSLVGDHAIHVLSDRVTNEVQIRNRASTIKSSHPAGAPQGSIANLHFVDDTNGWMMSAVNTCAKIRNPATDGPGLSCLQPVTQLDLFTTTDGGKTFSVITPHVSPPSSK